MEAWRGYSPLCSFKRGATEAKVPFHHRFRSRHIFGVAKDFCPNFPKLPQKVFCATFSYKFSPQRSLRPFLVWPPKRSSCVFLQTLGAVFWSQVTLGTIFLRIIRDVAMIFSKSKLLVCACIPSPPPPTPLPFIRAS